MSTDLSVEYETWKARKKVLLVSNPGEYAVIVGKELIGCFRSRELAYSHTVTLKGNVVMLIKHVVEKDEEDDFQYMGGSYADLSYVRP